MGEEIKATMNGGSDYLPLGKPRKTQNYFQFRSAEYQRISYHTIRSTLSYRKSSNSNQSYVRTRSVPENTQEYSRYRNATSLSATKNDQFFFPTSSPTKRTENEYSRYRDAQHHLLEKYHVQVHYLCRALTYDQVPRFPIPDEKVSWDVPFPNYMPVEYTTEKILRNPKADPADPSKIETYNQIDKKNDRTSFTGVYYIDPVTNRPRNPLGRTGVSGRGRLYYWGPNHAGDPVVTRWLRDENDNIVRRRINGHDELKPVLTFVAIRRRDNKQWALPGGMVDPGENVSETIKREFQEEAMTFGGDKSLINQLFSNGLKLFADYVDDPRNTDNAWMETVAVHFHDETGELTKMFHLHAGDDAEKVVWCPIDRTLELYACHNDIIKVVVDRLDAYW